MRALLLCLILALCGIAVQGHAIGRILQRHAAPVAPQPKLVIDRSAPRVERFSGRRVLEDVEMMEQRLTPVAFYQSTYLNCTDDSECCRNSRCAWPIKAVRGTTDHKTCIMNNIGNIANEVWCPPCTPAGAKYTNGKCDPSTAPKPPPAPTPSKPSNSSDSEKKDSQPSGTDTDPEADAEANEEGSGSQPRPRLPEADVIGEAPPTMLDSDSVDQVARWALLQRLQTKCDGLDEWCRDQLDGEDAGSSSSSGSSSGSWSNSLSPLSASSDSLSSSMSLNDI